MAAVFEYLASHPVVLIFGLMCLGMGLGRIKIRGIGLGAAGVLFAAIVVAAWASNSGVNVSIAPAFGEFGLAVFAFSVGITSGRNFFNGLKTALGAIAAVTALFLALAAAAYGLGTYVFGMSPALIGGVFSGALTNTPSLAAAGNASGDPATATVGYSVAYLVGVGGMMAAAFFALRYGRADRDAPSPVANQTIIVDRTDNPTVRDIYDLCQQRVTFSRVKLGDDPVEPAEPDDVLHKGDLITAVGPRKELARVAALLGRDSRESLMEDRSELDFRRITISDPNIAGRTVDSLHMVERFHATISRVRRGDVDMIAAPDLVLQEGDRVRVVAPTKRMTEITKFFGDSAMGLSDINPIALGFGMAAGLLLGVLPIPLGGGATFSIGAAAGTLLIGLVMGKLGRVGPVITTLPYTAAMVMSELGLLIFLAQAGTVAGGQISEAFASGEWLSILALGAILTGALAVGTYAMMRWGFHMGGTKLGGFIAGVQTQPAVLAFANGRTNFDPRVALGYSLIYPVAMIAKILITQVIAGL